MIDGAIYDGNGNVAMRYFQPITQFVNVEDSAYIFFPKRNVSMAWVKEAHVQKILGITQRCCGDNKSYPYKLANAGDVRVWENTAER